MTQPAQASSNLLLRFGEMYGNNIRHSGVDISAKPQGDVIAPVSGVVSFCGAVPNASGLLIKALTIQTDEGHLFTVSPLEHAFFQKGDLIEKSAVLGEVALDGDPSTELTHVHLSLRVNKKYVDPSELAGLLGSDVGSATTETELTTPSIHAPGISSSTQTVKQTVHSQDSARGQGQATTRTSVNSQAQGSHMPSAKVHEQPSLAILQQGGVQPVFTNLGLFKEKQLQHIQAYQAVSDGGVKVGAYTGATVNNPFSRPTLASVFFLSGLALTFAGWGGYTYLDGKFDLARKIGQLAVRGQR